MDDFIAIIMVVMLFFIPIALLVILKRTKDIFSVVGMIQGIMENARNLQLEHMEHSVGFNNKIIDGLETARGERKTLETGFQDYQRKADQLAEQIEVILSRLSSLDDLRAGVFSVNDGIYNLKEGMQQMGDAQQKSAQHLKIIQDAQGYARKTLDHLEYMSARMLDPEKLLATLREAALEAPNGLETLESSVREIAGKLDELADIMETMSAQVLEGYAKEVYAMVESLKERLPA